MKSNVRLHSILNCTSNDISQRNIIIDISLMNSLDLTTSSQASISMKNFLIEMIASEEVVKSRGSNEQKCFSWCSYVYEEGYLSE